MSECPSKLCDRVLVADCRTATTPRNCSMTTTNTSAAVCEHCGRMCEVEQPEQAGWVAGWDGWECPAHTDQQQDASARRGEV
jgi:hypothetical protein